MTVETDACPWKTKMTYNALNIRKMATGNLCLELSSDISAHAFPDHAKQFVKKVNAWTFFKSSDQKKRIWLIVVRFRPFYLTFDPSDSKMRLESLVKGCNSVIESLYNELIHKKG